MLKSAIALGFLSMLLVACVGCPDFDIFGTRRARAAAMEARAKEEEARAMAELVAKLATSTMQKANAAKSNQNSADFRILAWNIESGSADSTKTAERLQQIGEFDILALSEVSVDDQERFAAYWSKDSAIAGTTGGNDRLTIAWNPERFELVRSIELKEHAGVELAPGMHRAPLVAHLKAKSDGREFMVMNNHLARGNADLRLQQAKTLVEWARDQSLPIIAVGDYNFDYDFPTARSHAIWPQKSQFRSRVFLFPQASLKQAGFWF